MGMYNPPSGNNVNFSLRLIVIPNGNAVNYDLIGDLPVGYTSNISIIEFYNETFYWAEGSFIISDPSVIDLFGDHYYQALSNIQSEPSYIETISTTEVIRVLPDMISDPSVLEISAPFSEIVKGGITDLPNKMSTGGILIKWGGISDLDEFSTFKWKDASIVDNLLTLPTFPTFLVDSSVISDWNQLDIYDNSNTVQFEELNHVDASVQDSWISLFPVDNLGSIAYGNKHEITNWFTVPYKQPGPNDRNFDASYGLFSEQTIQFGFSWLVPPEKDKQQLVPWGPLSYFPYCSEKYFPPLDGIINFTLRPINTDLVGVGSGIIFDVHGMNTDPRCPIHNHHTGPRDPNTDSGAVDIHKRYPYLTPLKETYHMLNTILVRRLPDNAPIEVSSINIKYDRQSWLWQFSLTIPKDDNHDYISLIIPDPKNANLFTDIEIYLNGWKFICRVEGWSETCAFGKTEWSVTGRSPSMELGSPQNQKSSYIFDENGSSETAGAQIIDAILDGTMLGIDNTGWVADWSYYHDIHTGFDPEDGQQWGIPANTFSWTDKTQIEAIKMLTDSLGAFIITDPNCVGSNKKFFVRPHYDIPPWHWRVNSPFFPNIDHVVNVAYSPEIGRTYISQPVYDAVYVMGQSEASAQKTNSTPGIVVVDVFREGNSQSNRTYSADIVDPNITSWSAALERGRMAICDTGEWIRHTLRLFSIAEFTDANPKISRLILPGDFIKVNDKNGTWYGVADSTDLVAGNAGDSCVIYQTVEVRQYIGD